MIPAIKQAVIAHALEQPAEEVCGLLYYNEETVVAQRCANVSVDSRATSFEIAPNDYAAVTRLGVPCGIYHSHPVGCELRLTETDIALAAAMALPMYLYCVADGSWHSHVPSTYRVNPVGLNFIWGYHDCLSVVVTHYRQKLGIHLTDYERDASCENAGDSRIIRHVADEGFEYVDRKEPILLDDVLLFKGRGYPHHLGVLVGPNQILHHSIRQLSRIEPLDDHWLRRLVGVLRYTGRKVNP